jgi:hypothetical protein
MRKHASISLNGRRLWLHSSAILQRPRFLALSSTINMPLQFQVPRFTITKNRLISIKVLCIGAVLANAYKARA